MNKLKISLALIALIIPLLLCAKKRNIEFIKHGNHRIPVESFPFRYPCYGSLSEGYFKVGRPIHNVLICFSLQACTIASVICGDCT